MTPHKLLTIMKDKYEAERAEIVMNLSIFLESPKSIPEHTNFTADVDAMIIAISELDDKIETTERLIADFRMGI